MHYKHLLGFPEMSTPLWLTVYMHALAEDLGRLVVRGRGEKAATHIMIGDFIA